MVKWTAEIAGELGVEVGLSKYQTFWEYLSVLLCLLLWGKSFTRQSVAIVGDNTAALTCSLSLKARGCLAAVAREISWRQERESWLFVVGHIPSELNIVPDALSRQHEPTPAPWPTAALEGASSRELPDLSRLWRASES